MINHLHWLQTDCTVPYENLALEEYLTTRVSDDECILYLWQNRHTVVIGRNQNCWKECKIKALDRDGGYLARRLSGGGAVFHDLGNLNFTFISKKENYDIDRQLNVILEAVRSLGIHAEKTGRNDITSDGKKFSGNAFYQTGDFCCHHGTILVCADKEGMSSYLSVSRHKLESKGVSSVRSRVVNLCEYHSGLTIEQVSDALVQAYSRVYGLPAQKKDLSHVDQRELKKLADAFSSWDWLYGKKLPFNNHMEGHYSWGEIELQLCVNKGIIRDCKAYSDAMEQALIAQIPQYLNGQCYDIQDIGLAFEQLRLHCQPCAMNSAAAILGDILSLIRQNM